jgi:hypothetical protein
MDYLLALGAKCRSSLCVCVCVSVCVCVCVCVGVLALCVQGGYYANVEHYYTGRRSPPSLFLSISLSLSLSLSFSLSRSLFLFLVRSHFFVLHLFFCQNFSVCCFGKNQCIRCISSIFFLIFQSFILNILQPGAMPACALFFPKVVVVLFLNLSGFQAARGPETAVVPQHQGCHCQRGVYTDMHTQTRACTHIYINRPTYIHTYIHTYLHTYK